MNASLGPLLGDYRPRPTYPKPYRRISCVRRKVVTFWLAPGDPWPSLDKVQADIVVIQGVALTQSDIELWRERQGVLPQGANVLLGLPRKNLTATGRVDKSALRAYFSYDNFHWFLGGVPHSIVFRSGDSRAKVLTRLLASVFRGGPPPLRASLGDWLRVVSALLLNRGRLKLSPDLLRGKNSDGFYRTLKSFFVDSGILVEVDGGLGWTELRISGEFGDTRAPIGWLCYLFESLYGQEGSHGVVVEDLLRTLSRPPFGVTGMLAHHLVAIAASCHIGSLWWEGREGSFCIQHEQLLPLLQGGQGKLIFRPATPAEQVFLRSLRQLFRPLVEQRGDLALDPWEQTRKDVLHWYYELPGWTRAHRRNHSQQAQALLRICEEAPSHDSRHLLRSVLPEAFRWKEIPLPAEQAYFIDQINVARLELEGFLRGFLDKLTLGIYGILVGSKAELPVCREWLQRGRRTWVGGFLSGTFEGAAFSPWAEGLLSAVGGTVGFSVGDSRGGEAELEERWFVQLPRDLGLAPVREWETDHTQLFLARLGRARLELELGRYQEFFEGLSGPRKAETARNWIHLVLSLDDVPAEVAEEILALVLDDLE